MSRGRGLARLFALLVCMASASALVGCVVVRSPGGGISIQLATSVPSPATTQAPAAPEVGLTAVTVPDLNGRDVDEARAALRSLGFVPFTYDVPGWETSEHGTAYRTVVQQYPLEGRSWPVHTVVKLGIAVPEGMVTVPDIEGLPDAETTLKRLRLRPVEVPVHGPVDPDAAGVGLPYRQRPRAGAVVRVGSKVTYRAWWESQ